MLALIPVRLMAVIAAILAMYLFHTTSQRAAHVLSAWQLRKEYDVCMLNCVEAQLQRSVRGTQEESFLPLNGSHVQIYHPFRTFSGAFWEPGHCMHCTCKCL